MTGQSETNKQGSFSPLVIMAGKRQEKSRGWHVKAPWLGEDITIFGETKEDVLAQAERSRTAHIAELNAMAARWLNLTLEVKFVDGDGDW